MMVREKISGRPGRRLEENWRERLPTKWGREGEREKNAGKREITITKETEERTIEREIEMKKKKRIWGKRQN